MNFENSFEASNVVDNTGFIIGFVVNDDKSFKTLSKNLVKYQVQTGNRITTSNVSFADVLTKGV